MTPVWFRNCILQYLKLFYCLFQNKTFIKVCATKKDCFKNDNIFVLWETLLMSIIDLKVKFYIIQIMDLILLVHVQ